MCCANLQKLKTATRKFNQMEKAISHYSMGLTQTVMYGIMSRYQGQVLLRIRTFYHYGQCHTIICAIGDRQIQKSDPLSVRVSVSV